MAIRFYNVEVVKSASTNSDKFLSEFSSWLKASYVRDTTAVRELAERLISSQLNEEEDSFSVKFTGDYESTWTSDQLRYRMSRNNL